MSYKGKFRPSAPQKYKGDYTNIIYRSLWELRFMNWCDLNENIIEWGSEEFFIPYISPIDQKWHRYFPDFYMKVQESNGKKKTYIIEVKPKKQVAKPKIDWKLVAGHLDMSIFEFNIGTRTIA